jgi:hypothetical protein
MPSWLQVVLLIVPLALCLLGVSLFRFLNGAGAIEQDDQKRVAGGIFIVAIVQYLLTMIMLDPQNEQHVQFGVIIMIALAIQVFAATYVQLARNRYRSIILLPEGFRAPDPNAQIAEFQSSLP